MLRIDKTIIQKFNSHEEAEWDGFVEDATPEERFLMVWELTKAAYVFKAAGEGKDEPDFVTEGLRRDIISLERVQRCKDLD